MDGRVACSAILLTFQADSGCCGASLSALARFFRALRFCCSFIRRRFCLLLLRAMTVCSFLASTFRSDCTVKI